MTRARIVALTCVLAAAIARHALAGDPTQEARAAFEHGNDAHERHDFARAARDFARADELVPNDDALVAALDEATLADDAVFAMRLVQRAEARGAAAASVEKARAKFSDKVGYLKIACECTVDGEAAARGSVLVVAPGVHAVAGTRRGDATRVWSTPTTVVAGATLDVTEPTEPAGAPVRHEPTPHRTPLAPAPSGLSPAFVGVGVAITLGLGAGALGSFFDAMSKHDAFVGAGCSVAYAASCDAMASNGRGADLRTGILVGAAAVTAVATIVLAVVGVRWRSRPTAIALSPVSVRVAW